MQVTLNISSNNYFVQVAQDITLTVQEMFCNLMGKKRLFCDRILEGVTQVFRDL